MELSPLIDPALAPDADEARAARRAAEAAGAGRVVDLSSPEGVARARMPNPAFTVEQFNVAAERFDIEHDGRTIETRVIRSESATPTGVYLYVHGGGFYTGHPAMADRANAALASTVGLTVVSVRYRLAPEHPHPAAEDDVTAVAEWLVANAHEAFGTETLLIGGSSAGATLAVRSLLRLGNDRSRFVGANLIYGVFDLGGTPSQRREDLRFFDAYLPGLSRDERRIPEISPMYADLSNMPPAFFTVGSEDFVLDDSLFMSMRWAAAGNPAQLHVYPECGHGFDTAATQMSTIAVSRIHTWMRERLAADVPVVSAPASMPGTAR